MINPNTFAVIVTGASRGIGAACCRELRRQGVIVIGIARQEDKLKALSIETERDFEEIYGTEPSGGAKGDKKIELAPMYYVAGIPSTINNFFFFHLFAFR